MQGESKVVDLVAMAGLGFGLRGKERLAPMLSSRVAGVAPANKEIHMLPMFQPHFSVYAMSLRVQ
jgi:hypothetical protein